ncbi:peroxiredoxin family protein [Gracilimonas sp. Q87]|uniref:peroxiredoxin family protein n=1 Tax=Gracilimonas sp. Q87 TaxID=3384766 RepID=UPI00398450AA
MKKITLLAALTLLLLTVACSNRSEVKKTLVTGTITVADSIDSSGDFSGIGVTIVKRDSSNAPIDTLFHTLTDQSGAFEGEVSFPNRNYYPMIISRNNNDLASFRVILAENDTLRVNAQLPNIRETLTLDSNEHEAMQTLNRVDRSFQRVGAFIMSGAVPDSQILDETKKWSELYWQVYEAHENTMASYLAAEKSAELLGNWDSDAMMARIDEVLPADYMFSVALQLGKPYIAQSEGFDEASDYLDSLIRISENEEVTEFIVRDKIQMYFDSSRIKEAKDLLDNYEQDYSDSPSSKKWIRRIRYDLNYLAPGVTAPDFSFVTMEGDTVSNEKLKGSTYIIEITPLANFEYQNDYDRTMVISEIYKNYGLNIFTIPLDQSEVTVNAFFDERRKAWPVAKLGSFDVQDVIQKFNVVQVPTRILIDKDGVVIRKYERNEFSEVIQGLNRTFNDSNSPS